MRRTSRWLIAVSGIGAVVLVLALFGVFSSSPASDTKLLNAYTDILIERYRSADSLEYVRMFDSIATSYDLDPADMRNKLRNLSDDPDELRAFYDLVAARLDSLRTAESAREMRK